MTKKVMIDLETMGLKPGSVVLSIGAVLFDHECDDPWVGKENQQFHVRLDTDTQHGVGLRTNPDTALWWMGQSKEAQDAFLALEPVDPRQALAMFADWLIEHVEEEDDNGLLKVEAWGNGANFDPPMLREVYEALALRCPWGWFNERCYRTERKTLKRLLTKVDIRYAEPVLEGVQHDALTDAVHQANVLCSLERQLVPPRLT